MDDVIKSLTPEQALEVLKRLSEKGGDLGEVVLREAKDLLSETDPDQTAEEVFFALDTIEVQDCWDRSGRSRDGYTSPDEAAVQIIEEELQPFFWIKSSDITSWGCPSRRQPTPWGSFWESIAMSRSPRPEFKDWAGDTPGECAGYVMANWRERHQGTARQEAAYSFLSECCPE
jgi:hypothetical protein